ncbi:uncharacterized protein LOC117672256 isoform X1 [Pantherophis guttatus]|uniref:Uncharacterized protein LOC117672256 isoform X1 n=1 Tax=Pantherophis guttatus TaxID=94885 RepID=A0ABM3Z4F8_PANGU|nr:uncharacterized protein LOC117672256 isoform X1 [Pantherophis guttatus]
MNCECCLFFFFFFRTLELILHVSCISCVKSQGKRKVRKEHFTFSSSCSDRCAQVKEGTCEPALKWPYTSDCKRHKASGFAFQHLPWIRKCFFIPFLLHSLQRLTNSEELVQGKRLRGRPQLRYKDICKTLGMDTNNWETLTSDRSAWRLKTQHGLLQFEETLVRQAEAKRQSRNQRNLGARQGTECICPHVEGIATLELAFLVTLDAVLGPLSRAS